MDARLTKALAVTVAAGVMLMIVGAAFAEQKENDALKLSEAKISLGEAVAIAEAKMGGRAAKAEFESAVEGWIYDVEVVAGNKSPRVPTTECCEAGTV